VGRIRNESPKVTAGCGKKEVLRMKSIFAILSVVILASEIGHTQSAFQIHPQGVAGSAGAGVISFQIQDPQASNFTVNQGTFAAVSAEHGFGFAHLYLNLSLGYLTTTGNVNYNYTTLSGTKYTASNAAFQANIFQGALGLKWKIIDDYFLRPYVEGGGTAGYFTLNYTNLPNVLPSNSGTDYKSQDSLLEFGDYVEGGTEISFSPRFGIRAAARFVDSYSKQFDTLGKSSVHYKASIYYLALLANF
jgi:hypothetical protein